MNLVSGWRAISERVSFAYRNRIAFLVLMAAAVVFKLSAAALVPSSFELQEIMAMAIGRLDRGGPWIAVEKGVLLLWMSLTSSTNVPVNWWKAAAFVNPNGELSLLLVLTRLPAFLIDVATLVVLYVAVRDSSSVERARLAGLVWFLNPYTIFAVELLAVPDILAVFFTLVATLLVLYRRFFLSGAILAAGVAVKLYPILLVPVFLIICLPEVRKTWLLTISYALFIGLGLFGYFNWAAGALPLTALINYSPIIQPMTSIFNILPGARISLVTVALVVTYVATYLGTRSRQPHLAIAVLATILIYFTFSDPYPQYFLWPLPFLIFDLAYSKGRGVFLAGLLALQLSDWFFLSHGFLTPSGYSMLLFGLRGQNLPAYCLSISSFLNQYADFAVLVVSTLLYALTLIYSLDVMRRWFAVPGSADHPSRGM